MRWVILFDIDGTLIDCGGAGRRSIERAFGEIVGRPDALAEIRFGGMTDHGIVREALAAIGRAYDRVVAESVLERYLALLEEDLRTSATYRVHRGAEEAVELARASGHAVGLGTGNVRGGARVKLARGRLWERFEFGGFGCDAELRDEVLRTGEARGRALASQADRTLVVGDTPKDVRAAKAVGAVSLAVTTGTFSRAELEEEGASFVVDALDEPLAREVLQGRIVA
jgi:phosphoglycolate phosphatase